MNEPQRTRRVQSITKVWVGGVERAKPHSRKFQPYWMLPLSVLASGSIVGCSALGDFMSNSDPNLGLPPCVDNVCDCSSFNSQEQAQLVLDSFENDPYQLDGDGNGRACERLPATIAPLERETYFSNNPHLVLGNPSHANTANLSNYLIERPQYVLGYSQSRNTLLWASWQVTRDWLGSTDRQDDFRPDVSLPRGLYQVSPADYGDRRYDRGHMVPSADRTNSRQDNSATFLMSNIFPQTAENNRGPWRELEEYCRDLIYQQGKSLYIIGGIYGEERRLSRDRIVVPGRTWKVIVIFDGNIAPEQVTEYTETIAVDMPNSDYLDAEWQTYLTSIDRLEQVTGYDLLSEVNEEVQAAIEARR
jgi:endonuclease G, mitochondrial